MRRFQRILYVFDRAPEHDASLDRALAVARHAGAILTLAALVSDPDDGEQAERARAGLEPLCTTLRCPIDDVEAASASTSIDLVCTVLSGEPHVAVIREVLRAQHDLVMKRALPDHGIAERIFGSLDTQLIELCPSPVWIDRPTPHARYERILACVEVLGRDGSELNLSIVDLASAVAVFEGASLFVVTAFEIEGELLMRGRAATEAARRQIDELVESERRRRLVALEALLEPFRDRPLNIQPKVVKGDPVRVIPEVARELQIDLIVLGTTIRSHLMGILLGSTAQAVLRTADCGILVVKPPTFETPIRLETDA